MCANGFLQQRPARSGVDIIRRLIEWSRLAPHNIDGEGQTAKRAEANESNGFVGLDPRE